MFAHMCATKAQGSANIAVTEVRMGRKRHDFYPSEHFCAVSPNIQTKNFNFISASTAFFLGLVSVSDKEDLGFYF